VALQEKICTTPANGIRLCAADSECDTGDVCCTIYDQSICLPPTSCPKACAASSECQTALGEICCTAFAAIEPALNVGGLCVDPSYNPCPTTCTQSADCNNAVGEICCDGICQTSCRKTCRESSDCNGQICCKSALNRLPRAARIFTTGPTCAGAPFYTCSQCGSLLSCSCPGCASAGGGSCSGTRFYPCSTYSFYPEFEPYCRSAGCSWTASTLTCSGTPLPCASITSQTTCNMQLECLWSSSGACNGTPTLCSQLSPTTCSSQPGCALTNF